MSVECATPPDYQGDLLPAPAPRPGAQVEAKAGLTVIRAEAPLAEMFGYSNAIRSLSKGRADNPTTPLRYETTPAETRRQSAGETVSKRAVQKTDPMKRAGDTNLRPVFIFRGQ